MYDVRCCTGGEPESSMSHLFSEFRDSKLYRHLIDECGLDEGFVETQFEDYVGRLERMLNSILISSLELLKIGRIFNATVLYFTSIMIFKVEEHCMLILTLVCGAAESLFVN